MREIRLTAVFMKVPEGYVGFVEELPGANTRARPWRNREKTSERLSPSFWRRTVR